MEYSDKSVYPNALFSMSRVICKDGVITKDENAMLKLLIDSGAMDEKFSRAAKLLKTDK